MRSIGIGIAAGLFAAWLMNQFQSALSAASSDNGGSGQSDEEKPTTVKAADMVSNTLTGSPVPERFEQPAGSAVHYGFGAFLGGLYSAWGAIQPGVRSGFGTVYGTGVALVADEALVSAAGLTPPPNEVPAMTHAYGLVSHLVFGAALEGGRRLIEQAVTGGDPKRGSNRPRQLARQDG